MKKFGYPLYVYPDKPDEKVVGFQLIGPFETADETVKYLRDNVKDFSGQQAPVGVLVFDAEIVPLLAATKSAA